MRLARLIPLHHRGFGHEVRLRDLAGGEAADGPQRQGDGRGGGEARVRAQKVQLQGVIHGGNGHSSAGPEVDSWHTSPTARPPLRSS